MKKLFAILTVLCLFCSAVAFAESPAVTLRNGAAFGMNMNDVIATETSSFYEVDHERTHGPVSFTELEYEHITENGIPADLKYLFVADELVALRISYDMEDAGVSYAAVKDQLVKEYGESAELDLSTLGNGIYAVDDDGRTEGRTEAWINGNMMIVLELDRDDIEVTFVNLDAGFIR